MVRIEEADVDLQQTTRLAPLLEMIRAAAGAADRSAFLPVVVREAATLLDAVECEMWLEADGPVRVAAKSGSEAGGAPLDARSVATVIDEGDVSVVDGWLCVPLPQTDADVPAALLAVRRSAAPSTEDVALAEVAAAVARMGLDTADAGRMDAASRDEFLALLGHDLRSPLSNVRVGAQLAQRNLDAGDIESVREALKIIESQSGRLLARLEALLDAVAASGGWLIKLERLDLGEMLAETVEPYRLADTDQATTFDIEVASGAPAARGDAGQIAQVLEHLVDNAAKYAAGGHVEIRVTPQDGAVRVDVCDDGPGIRPEDVDRVFAPFGRGRNAGDTSGYGLGLYLARNIVRAHGGRLWIARTSRSGTCMAMTLPAALDEDAGEPS